ncbi:MAG: extracellular solute-binding protein [Treponema sp.]|nr:extracellular solute-binding protein [Treponema sp.]
MKRIGLVLMLLLAASMIFASGGAQSAGGSTAASRPAGMTASGYPITTDGSITLRYWTILNAAASKFIQSYAENTAYQEMEKRTGIKIQWIHPASGMEREQFNLLMASGDLPDIIACADYYKGGEFQGLYDGLFTDLTNLIPQYAPDYMKFIKDDPEFYREVSDDAGKICAVYAYKPMGDPPFTRVVLRQDILDQINSDIPKLISDYDAMFPKMAAAGIVPFMPSRNGYIKMFVGAFDVIPGLYKDLSGKLQFGQVQPGFRQYLEMMNRWYAAGYISKDFTSLDVNQANALFDARKIGMQIGPIVANYNRGDTLGYKVTSAPYPRVTPGQQLHHNDVDIWPLTGKDTRMAVIASSSKNQEAALRWLNYGWTPDGIDLMNWGVEGLNYNVIDGKKVYNDLMLHNPKFGTEEASYIYKMHFAPKYVILDTICHANLLISPASLASRFLWADDPNVDTVLNIPPYQLNMSEQNLRTKVLSEINTYVDEMTLKFITGAEPLSRWDAYVATVNTMGLPDLLKSEQTAYDRYLTKTMK